MFKKKEKKVEEIGNEVWCLAEEVKLEDAKLAEPIVVILEEKMPMTPYLRMFYKAWEDRFGQKNQQEEGITDIKEVEVVMAAAAAPAVATVKTKIYRKSIVAVVFAMIFALIAIVVAVLSYFEVTAYTDLYFGYSLALLIELVTGSRAVLLDYIIIVSIALALVAALGTIIAGIVALASKKRAGILIIAIIAFVFALVSGISVVINFVMDDAKILEALNPTLNEGFGAGMYAIIASALFSMIAAIFTYKKVAVIAQI